MSSAILPLYETSITIIGRVAWNDGRRLLFLKQEVLDILPILRERSKDIDYRMIVCLDKEALFKRMDQVSKESIPTIILNFYERNRRI